MREHPRAGSQGAAARLLDELETSWQVIASLSDELSLSSSSRPETSNFSGSLPDTHAWYKEASSQVLARPINEFLKLLPIDRTLEALEACDGEADGKSIHARTKIDNRFVRLLVRASLDLCEPWRIWRGGNHLQEWEAWDQRRISRSREAVNLLERYREWAARSSTATANSEHPPNDVVTEKRWRERNAVTATMQLEVALRDLTFEWFDSTERLLSDIHREREQIQANGASTLTWLEHDGTEAPEAPAPVSPEERLRTWASPIESEAARRLPERVEILLLDPIPRWRSSPAAENSLRAFQTYARMPMGELIQQSWTVSARTVREIWQAREIVNYWRSSVGSTDEMSEPLTDARQNAISLLKEQLHPDPELERLDARTVEAFWVWHQKGSLAFEVDQFGWTTLLRQPRGRAALDTAAHFGKLRAKSSTQRIGRWATGKIDNVLEVVGGRVPAQPSVEPVVRRTTLRDTLSLPAAKTTLPILYRLLFRLAPVEDRRFLMGRERKLAGLTQATEDWESGRFAACLMIGGRGSGKTSLLNCAIADVFSGRQTIRAQFDERILTPDRLNAFLRRLLDIKGNGNIEAAFRSGRRIVILEESERIFLRKVGGFAAARHLLHLIHRTAPTTLWIIVMNDKAFRVLDAAADLHRVFSHRINATNVSRADLENAILERHRLSGLRLKFVPPPAGDPRVNRAKRWLGLEDSPQKLFFDSLFQQSEGIFRSAFELWLSSIQSADGGTLTIRQPLDPAFGRFRSELAHEDNFTLLLIQEHGSLTQHELAQVLCEPYDVSNSRMERLAALGLIEPDPAHPGSRVRPEAQRFVNDLLRRTNLT